MDKCSNCPLRDHAADCFAQTSGHLRFCELSKSSPDYARLLWERSTTDPVPPELQAVAPPVETAIVPVEPAQEPVKVEPQPTPSKGCGCGERKPLVDRKRPKALSPEEQEAHRKRIQNLWNERMRQKKNRKS